MKSLLLILFSAAAAFGQGTILWDESVNGTFSHDFTQPTALNQFSVGTNSVLGATEITPVGNNWEATPDFFTIPVPPNSAVTAIYLHIDRPNVWAGLKDPTYSTDLGFAPNPSNGNLLPQWSLNSIGPGLYGMFMQNNDAQAFTSIANYRLDFFVGPNVPEPSSVLVFMVGTAVLFGVCRRRKSDRI